MSPSIEREKSTCVLRSKSGTTAQDLDVDSYRRTGIWNSFFVETVQIDIFIVMLGLARRVGTKGRERERESESER